MELENINNQAKPQNEGLPEDNAEYKNIDLSDVSEKKHPLEKTNFIGKFFFCWVWNLVLTSWKTPWTQSMHSRLPQFDKAETHCQRLSKQFKRRSGLFTTIIAAYPLKISLIVLAVLLIKLSGFYITSLNSNAIALIEKDVRNPDILRALIFNFALVTFVRLTQSLISNLVSFTASRLSLSIRSGLFVMIQNKVLRFSHLSSGEFNAGHLTDLVQVDTVKIGSFIGRWYTFISRLLGSVGAVIYLLLKFGWELTLVSIGTYMAFTTLYFVVYCYRNRVTKEYLETKDARMSVFRSVLRNLEFLKINGLEDDFNLKVFKKRESEVTRLIWQAYVMSSANFLDHLIPNMTTWFIIFYFSFLTDKKLAYSDYIAFDGILGIFKVDCGTLLASTTLLIQMMVSVGRLDRFFKAGDMDVGHITELGENGDGNESLALEVQDGNFGWLDVAKIRRRKLRRKKKGARKAKRVGRVQPQDNNRSMNDESAEGRKLVSSPTNSEGNEPGFSFNFSLKELNFKVAKGEKVAVIGRNGSGKSSLLYSLIGEMLPIPQEETQKMAKITKSGKMAFLSQNRWTIPDSILANILHGRPLETEELEETLKATQLIKDINKLDKGIETVLGDNASTVSGGQRTRIALARALYQKADIYLLDDPLSSLDNKVANQIMRSLFKDKTGLWVEKTFLMVTSNLGVLSFFDRVLILDKGELAFDGGFEALKANKLFKELQAEDAEQKNQKASSGAVFGKQTNPTNPFNNWEDLEDADDAEGLDIDKDNQNAAENEENNNLVSYQFEGQGANQLESSNPFAKASDAEKPKEERLSLQLTNPANRKERDIEDQSPDRVNGTIALSVLQRVIQFTGGYAWLIWILFVSIMILICLYQTDLIALRFTDNYFNRDIKDTSTTTFYALLIVVTCIANFTKTFSIMISVTWMARRLHASVIDKLLHSDLLKLLRKTPLAVLLNRFSNDIAILDKNWWINLTYFIQFSLTCSLSIYSILAANKNGFALIPSFLYIVFGIILRQVYMRAVREIVRLEYISKGPLLGGVVSVIEGSSVIRASGKQAHCRKTLVERVEENMKNSLMSLGLDSWISVQLELLNLFVVLVPTYSLMISYLYYNYDPNSDGYAAVAYFILKVAGIPGDFDLIVSYTIGLETVLISAERCLRLEESHQEGEEELLKQSEDRFRTMTFEKAQLLKKEVMRPKDNNRLITTGTIEFRNMSAAYPGTETQVLKKINLRIESGEKGA